LASCPFRVRTFVVKDTDARGQILNGVLVSPSAALVLRKPVIHRLDEVRRLTSRPASKLQTSLWIKTVGKSESLNESFRGSNWIGIVRDASSHGKKHSGDDRDCFLIHITWHVVTLYDLEAPVLQVHDSSSPLQLGTYGSGRHIPSNGANKCTKSKLVVLKR